jgi:hypothetical protein
MPNAQNTTRFATQLLQQDEPLSDSQYKEYRMKLENALTTAQRRQKLAYRVVVVSCVVSFTLMFVGGSGIFGSFDPWEKEANIVSMTLGVIYLLAAVIFPLSLASYYSRFRPRVREAREQLRDASILDLQREMCELRKQIAAALQDKDPT